MQIFLLNYAALLDGSLNKIKSSKETIQRGLPKEGRFETNIRSWRLHIPQQGTLKNLRPRTPGS